MKKYLSAIVVLFLAASVGASGVMTFVNFERDGVPVLIPEVQKYEAAEGAFPLPDTLGVAIPAGEELIVEQLADDLKRFGKTAAAAGDGACRFEIAETGVPEHAEGYVLTVSSTGISVRFARIVMNSILSVFYISKFLKIVNTLKSLLELVIISPILAKLDLMKY